MDAERQDEVLSSTQGFCELRPQAISFSRMAGLFVHAIRRNEEADVLSDNLLSQVGMRAYEIAWRLP